MKKLTREDKLKMLKNQVNNIDVIGKVLTQESNLIEDFKKKNNLVTHKSWFTQRAHLDQVQTAINLTIKHFQGRVEAVEGQIKLLELPIGEKK